MKKTGIFILSLALAMFARPFGSMPAQATELLTNGNLESSAAPSGWSMSTFITGMPGTTIPEVVEHVDGGDHYVEPSPPNPAPGLGLLLHPMKGNQGLYEDQDKRANLILEQTWGNSLVPATPTRTYTFRGDVFMQAGYSGIVNPPNTLNPLFPKADYNSGTVVDATDYVLWRTNLGSEIALHQEGPGITPGSVTEDDYDYWRTKFGNVGRPAGVLSPTVTKFFITFLNASDVELGTTEYNLRSNPATEIWRITDQVSAVAPATTQKVRVRVSVLDMVDNCCALGQDVLFDNFTLFDNVTGANKLVNGDLNTPGLPAGWTTTEGPSGTSQTPSGGVGPVQTANSVDFIAFANRLSDTPNSNPTPPFATLPTGKNGMWLRPYVNKTQFNPDLPEVFGWAAQELNSAPGAEYTFSAWSAWESGYSAAQTFMKIEFLNGTSVIDSETLDLVAAGQVADAANSTIGPGNENGGNVEFNDWRQFSLSRVAPLNTTKVRVSLGATGMFFNDLDNFQSGFFDEMSLTATGPGTGHAVPEPGCLVLIGIAVGLAAAARGRSRV